MTTIEPAVRHAGRSRRIAAMSAALACGLLALCPPVFALNAALDSRQYVHTAWKIRDGFVKGAISSIAQTPDGYL